MWKDRIETFEFIRLAESEQAFCSSTGECLVAFEGDNLVGINCNSHDLT